MITLGNMDKHDNDNGMLYESIRIPTSRANAYIIRTVPVQRIIYLHYLSLLREF
jgi:hypothetical protein